LTLIDRDLNPLIRLSTPVKFALDSQRAAIYATNVNKQLNCESFITNCTGRAFGRIPVAEDIFLSRSMTSDYSNKQ